jgi:hypothetical protein
MMCDVVPPCGVWWKGYRREPCGKLINAAQTTLVYQNDELLDHIVDEDLPYAATRQDIQIAK